MPQIHPSFARRRVSLPDGWDSSVFVRRTREFRLRQELARRRVYLPDGWDLSVFVRRTREFRLRQELARRREYLPDGWTWDLLVFVRRTREFRLRQELARRLHEFRRVVVGLAWACFRGGKGRKTAGCWRGDSCRSRGAYEPLSRPGGVAVGCRLSFSVFQELLTPLGVFFRRGFGFRAYSSASPFGARSLLGPQRHQIFRSKIENPAAALFIHSCLDHLFGANVVCPHLVNH